MAPKLKDPNLFKEDKVNHSKKLIYLETRKCASTTIAKLLLDVNDGWEILPQAEKEELKDTYTTFGFIRHPISWCLSGYVMMASRRDFSPKLFLDHLKYINNPIRLFKKNKPLIYPNWEDWYLHSGVLPDENFYKTTHVFKVEEILKFQIWFSQYYPEVVDYKLPKLNAMGDNYCKFKNINLRDKEVQELIKRKFLYYAMKHNYKLDYEFYQKQLEDIWKQCEEV